jgi:hypothetical protein
VADASDTTKRTAGGEGALIGALASLLEPLARLAVARGLPHAPVEDLLKAAFVEAARRAQPPSAGTRIVSRVATATGLTRREVTRLLEAPRGAPAVRPAPATQVFTRWIADPRLRDRKGQPRPLRRQGPAPSFEALARAVTQDVHPRSLLEELLRLGLVAEDGDEVRVLRDSVVPEAGSDRALAFVGSNVGDHLRGAIDNVLADAPPHLEQAVFADRLSDESMATFRTLAKAQWQALLAATVPQLQALVDADRAAGRERNQRVRLGIYAYQTPMDPEPEPSPPEPARRRGTSAAAALAATKRPRPRPRKDT